MTKQSRGVWGTHSRLSDRIKLDLHITTDWNEEATRAIRITLDRPANGDDRPLLRRLYLTG
jgi:hypothetical protein